MSDWFYYLNGQKNGPVPPDVIVSSIMNGGMPADTKIKTEEMTEWVPFNRSSLASPPSKSNLSHPEVMEELMFPVDIKEKIKNVIISTGDLKKEYDIIDIVFAIDSADEGLFGQLLQKSIGLHVGADPGIAFAKLKDQLRFRCHELGGNAIINCQFEHRVAAAQGLMGAKQRVEMFAYGTAVLVHHQ